MRIRRGFGRGAAITVTALLGLAAPSAAQEAVERWRRLDLELGPSYTNTAIYGTAFRPAGDDYDNAFSQFSDGWGVNAIGHLVARPSSLWSRTEVSIGPFLTWERTLFRGRTISNLAVDAHYGDMLVDRLLTGLHLRLRFGSPLSATRFFLGFQFGGGLSIIHDTHLRIDASPSGGPWFGGALYQRTVTGTFGGAFRLGWSIELADEVGLTFFAFTGVWKSGRPEDVKNDPSLAPSNPGDLTGWAVGVGLSVELRFDLARRAVREAAAKPRRPALRSP